MLELGFSKSKNVPWVSKCQGVGEIEKNNHIRGLEDCIWVKIVLPIFLSGIALYYGFAFLSL